MDTLHAQLRPDTFAMRCGAELRETSITKFFEQYEQLFNKCVGDGIDMEECHRFMLLRS
jgi:hypothetical protein